MNRRRRNGFNTSNEPGKRFGARESDSESAPLSQDDPAMLKPKEGRRLLNPLLLGALFIVAVVAAFAPLDVLDRHPVLAAFTTQMIAWFPFLGIHAAGSAYPQVMTLTKCTSLAMLPLSIAGVWFAVWPIRKEYVAQISAKVRPPIPWWAVPVCVLLLTAVFPFNWLIAGDPSTCKGCTTANRAWLAFIELGAVLGVGMFAATIPLGIYLRRAMKRSGRRS